MKAATKAKLEEFAKFIETLSPKTFNMETWVGIENHSKYKNTPNTNRDEDGNVLVTESNVGKCGTACCLGGWEVARKGFYLDPDGNDAVFAKIDMPFGNKVVYAEISSYVPDFAKSSLGLTDEEADLLFIPYEWPTSDDGDGLDDPYSLFPNTPKGAAARIRHLIKTGK